MSEHVILVAVTVQAPSREVAQAQVAENLTVRIDPTDPEWWGALPDVKPRVIDWWVAEDDRWDGSDRDSAVFVRPGYQAPASALLVATEFTPSCNRVPDDRPIIVSSDIVRSA